MTIQEAGKSANDYWNKKFKQSGEACYVPPRVRKTLLHALSEAREGMTMEQRLDRLCKTINRGCV